MAHSTVWDADPVLRINKTTRLVEVPTACRVIGVEGDHRAEVLTIECPRTIDGHDVAGCAARWVSWKNAAGTTGRYDVGSVEVHGDVVRFTWLADAGVTARAGDVSFSVHFADFGPTGELLYKWSTATCKDLRVLHTTESLADDDHSLLYADIDEGEVNAAVYNAVRRVLYG